MCIFQLAKSKICFVPTNPTNPKLYKGLLFNGYFNKLLEKLLEK